MLTTLRGLVSRIRAVARSRHLDDEFDDELAAHVVMATEDYVKSGLTPEQARRAALLRLGGRTSLKDQHRDVRGIPLLEATWQDTRYSVRSLRKALGFTAIAVLTLSLGIGLVTTQMSFVNAALFKGLPFERSERIMTISRLDQQGRSLSTQKEQFEEWRTAQKSFGVLAAHTRESIEMSAEGFPMRTYKGAAFSADVLKLLGVRPMLGRGFSVEDERTDAPPVLLISQRVWKNDFSADPNVVGRSVRLRGEPATIVGVMPEEFAFPVSEVAWVNLRPGSTSGQNRPGMLSTVNVIGRLKDDATLAGARAEYNVLVNGSSPSGGKNQTLRARIVPYTELNREDGLTIILLALLWVVIGVLAVACLNVANLLSARALQNAHQLALRAALGASRSRLVRQMLTESCVLAVLGAIGGLLLAFWGLPMLNRGIASDETPFWVVVDLDYGVLAATVGLTLVVGVLAGLFPALRATRRDAGAMLKDVAGGGGNVRLGRFNRWLVIAQVGLSCAVLLATSVLVDAARKGSKIEFPFKPEKVLSAELRLTTAEFATEATRLQFQLALMERVRALPGMEASTFTTSFPYARMTGLASLEVMGAREGADVEPPRGFINPVLDGFFRDMRIPLREGREFAPTDIAGSERVTIVSENLARRLWPGESPIGKRIRRRGVSGASTETWMTVVGVATELPIDAPHRRQGIHVPVRQHPATQITLLLNPAQDPQMLIRPLQDTVRALSVDVPLDHVQTLATRLSEELGPLRVMGLLSLIFGVSGLLLAAVGVYGVTSFSVRRRIREFGIRIAIGATPRDLLRLVFKQGGRQLGIGLGIGALVGAALSVPLLHAMAALAKPPGVSNYLMVFGGVAIAVVVALWWPARRAARVDPITALRAE